MDEIISEIRGLTGTIAPKNWTYYTLNDVTIKMVELSINKELRNVTQLILNCKKQYGLMKNAVDRMYQVFLEFIDVDISDQNAPDIVLVSGVP